VQFKPMRSPFYAGVSGCREDRAHAVDACQALGGGRSHQAFGAKGLRIERPNQIAPTLKRALAMQGPVVVGIPVDYRDNHRLMEILHPSVLN
jgi:hypothetical protein